MKETPMMQQFMGFKRQYPDKLLLYRMGDFFETFGEDAKITSKILNITLTSRDRNADATPLAGFPHHAINQYLPKLVKAGHCVVVVDQIEDPKFAKGIVKRGVTRIVTPGTLEEDESAYVKNIYLLALCRIKNTIAGGLIDLSTGVFQVTEVLFSNNGLENILNSFDPAEILLLDNESEIKVSRYPVQFIESSFVKSKDYEKCIKDFYHINSLNALNLKSETASAIAVGMILKYVSETQKMNPDHISKPLLFKLDGSMYLDSGTIRNLDIVSNSASGNSEGSLINVLNETRTNMGRRMLYSWLLNPLLDAQNIQKRLNIVDYFFNNYQTLVDVRELLSEINDLERIVGKIGLNRANARDFRAMFNSLLKAEEIYRLLTEFNNTYKLLSLELFDDKSSRSLKSFALAIDKTIAEYPPLAITEGYIIKDGFNPKIDEIRSLSGNSKDWVKNFINEEKAKTGISTLKIGFNKVFGYYIEVSKSNQDKVPGYYIRKQTLVNCERYITEELKVKEDEILNAEERLSKLEFDVFQQFREGSIPYISNIRKLSVELSQLDVLQGFAYLANSYNYVKPVISPIGTKGRNIVIKDGRHPVVERLVGDEFISNDTILNDSNRMMNILTGPNMSGKSTYIRQVALIILLAQIGCFVPATSAEITLVDRIFTRVGASDDLTRGRSTFMVEMDEAANILNNATENSLVILDEIGRGTSTYDGVSIAWALAEYLITNVKSRTLFATHYHELLILSENMPEFVKNLNVQVDEDEEKDEVIFLRKIVEGGTDRSYGIYVAKMAGLPESMIVRAKEILSSFEQTSLFGQKNLDLIAEKPKEAKEEVVEKDYKAPYNQLGLFDNSNNYLFSEIRDLKIENLTPLEALNKISEWKKRLM